MQTSKIDSKISQNNKFEVKTGTEIYKNSELDFFRSLFAPFSKRVYLVGGCVRDALLGREIYDYDIEVYDIEPLKFDELMASIKASGVGKSYFIYKYKNYDLGLPRSESKTGNSHKDFAVSYINDPSLASLRRDFTVNAMMMNIFNGEILDFHGGKKDLEGKTLRHIDSEKFKEDPLRVLRGVQFSARLDFSIANKTLELMKTLDLAHLSRDRINTELIKFFRAKELEKGAFYLFRLELFREIFGVQIYGSDEFLAELKSARKFVDDERLFLYMLFGKFELDAKEILEKMRLPKSYFSILKEPYFKDMPSDSELLQIALNMPLKSWLGAYNKERIERAKELGVYEAKFDAKVDMSEILATGFKNEMIAAEIKRRQLLAITKHLETLAKR
ncbi:CCA tRNA nucleotidyltransferase [Campylobacter concisus]|uniref:CCA tRNA nucleotidyltransferase n=1 Tax=Campylobacter concisus TaxID=199 RepID=UPI0003989F17|nr:CCA tRNA nucleotidyltransferase [Campylobacter concisus]ERJ28278.1 tRNA nucleotidyltransferase [Campylobacter concisus ATCC 51561]